MSVPVLRMVNSAARKVGDPNKTRVLLDQWGEIYNEAQRKFCEKVNALKIRNIFTPTTGQAYTYPTNMTVMTMMEVTDSPGDDDSWREVKEMFEDEFRRATSNRYPSAALPTHYFSTANWFYLIPRPEVAIVGGGRITHYRLPDAITDPTTAVLQAEDFTEDYIVSRMVIEAKQSLNRLVEAESDLRTWEKEMEGVQDKFDDRSLDRRSSIAPRKNRLFGMR